MGQPGCNGTVIAAQRDLEYCMHRPTNECSWHAKKLCQYMTDSCSIAKKERVLRRTESYLTF